MDLTEAEDIKKRWQEYTEELYRTELQDPDNHNGVISSRSTPPIPFLAPWCRDQASPESGPWPHLHLLALKMGLLLPPPHRVWEDPVRSHVILVRAEAGTREGAIYSRALPSPSALCFSSAIPWPGSPLVFSDPAPPTGSV